MDTFIYDSQSMCFLLGMEFIGSHGQLYLHLISQRAKKQILTVLLVRSTASLFLREVTALCKCSIASLDMLTTTCYLLWYSVMMVDMK